MSFAFVIIATLPPDKLILHDARLSVQILTWGYLYPSIVRGGDKGPIGGGGGEIST